jgi:hypothetical protein
VKAQDVPQDQDPTFEGHKKICYALGPDGKFVPVHTSGWSVEADAKNLAWQAIEADLEKCRQRVAGAKASPLEYYMKFRQMDPKLLADNMGICVWRVKWHMRPQRFRRLDGQWLRRYAECLDIPVERLSEPGV